MSRALAILALVALPASAMAQTAVSGSDVEAVQAEVDRDYAAAQAADCTTACLALDSMRRATDHLCALDPGDRCARARQKLVDATTHVRASCPACGEQLKEEPGAGGAPPAPPPPSPTSANVAEEAQVSKRGGCAGCATSGPTGGALAPLGALVAVLLAARRRRTR